MDYSLSKILNDNIPTKQRIMICALQMFCTKGYSETSIRDIASAVGISPGAIYGHFESKEELLNCMLSEYAENTKNLFHRVDIESILKEKPTGEGVSLCLVSSFSVLSEDVYYANLVHLIHQEQHRNPLFGSFILLRMKETTEFITRIFDVLKSLNALRADVDPEYWGVFTYSLLHTISSCTAINIAQKTAGYTMMDLPKMLRCLFDAALIASKPPDGGA